MWTKFGSTRLNNSEAIAFFYNTNYLKIDRACYTNIRRCSMLVARPQMCGVNLEAQASLTVKLLDVIPYKNS